jgi:hypothetical protein
MGAHGGAPTADGTEGLLGESLGGWLRRRGLPADGQRDLLDHRIKGGEERVFVPLAACFDDDALAIGVADVMSLDDQLITGSCFHNRPPVIARLSISPVQGFTPYEVVTEALPG